MRPNGFVNRLLSVVVEKLIRRRRNENPCVPAGYALPSEPQQQLLLIPNFQEERLEVGYIGWFEAIGVIGRNK